MPIALRGMLGLLLIVSVAEQASRAGEIDWLSDVDVAWRTAVAQDRPILLFVTRSNCRYCVEMKNKTFRDADVADHVNQAYVPVTVDAKQIADLAKQLEITGYPTTVIISPRAEVVDRMKGYLPPSRFKTHLEQAAPLEKVASRQKKTS